MDEKTRYQAGRSRGGRCDGAVAGGTLRLDPGADREAAPPASPGLDGATAAAVRAVDDPGIAPPRMDLPAGRRPWWSYAVCHLRAAGRAEQRRTHRHTRRPTTGTTHETAST